MQRRLSTILAFVCLSALALPSTAAADELAGLKSELGPSIDAVIRDDIGKATGDVVNGSGRFAWIATETARAKLSPIVRDCFTADCLQKAGKSTGAEAGLKLAFAGEAQIYDWTIEIYDLRDGSRMVTRKGSCELCGRSEVVRNYRASLSEALKNAKPKASKPVATAPKEKAPAKSKPLPRPEDLGKTSATVKIVKVEIDPEPADALIIYNDQEVGRGKQTLELSPGEHQLMLKADGHRTVKELVVIDDSPEARDTRIRIHLPKKDAPPEAVLVASNGPIDKLGSDRAMYGLIGVSTGLVTLGIGAYLAAIDGDTACDNGAVTDCPEVYDTGGASFVTTLTGATLLTAGGVLLAWDLLAGEAVTEDDVKVAPTVGEDSAGLVIFGRF